MISRRDGDPREEGREDEEAGGEAWPGGDGAVTPGLWLLLLSLPPVLAIAVAMVEASG